MGYTIPIGYCALSNVALLRIHIYLGVLNNAYEGTYTHAHTHTHTGTYERGPHKRKRECISNNRIKSVT